MTGSTSPLIDVKCNVCNDAYALLRGQLKRYEDFGQLVFTCRRCKLITFAEKIEELLKDGPGHFGLTDDDLETFALLFLSNAKELHVEVDS